MAASRPAAAVAVSILQPTYSETDYASFFAHRHEKKKIFRAAKVKQLGKEGFLGVEIWNWVGKKTQLSQASKFGLNLVKIFAFMGSWEERANSKMQILKRRRRLDSTKLGSRQTWRFRKSLKWCHIPCNLKTNVIFNDILTLSRRDVFRKNCGLRACLGSWYQSEAKWQPLITLKEARKWQAGD